MEMEGPGFEEDYEDEYYEDWDSGGTRSEHLAQLYRYCVEPSVREGYANLVVLFACCLIYRTVCNAIRTPQTSHILSSAIGIYVLYLYFRFQVLHTLSLVVVGYCIILLLSNLGRSRGFITSTLLILYLVLCEKYFVDSNTWVKIRGPQMIAAMKIISIAFDLDSRSVLRVDIYEYVGYTLCPGTCVWGPWVSFAEYKSKQERVDDDYKWILKGFLSAGMSVLYFVSSTCLIEFLIPTAWEGWWVVYRDALSFRTGHYFVSSVSEASTSFSGYISNTVSRPWKIEIPRSLAEVVVHWNVPTHKFLKTYVFKTTIGWGAFSAIMMTYFVSSLLHGLNFRLAAVLLSLGFYTFTEHSIRLKLSSLFDACLGARPCPHPCPKHSHTRSNLLVHLVGLLLTLVAMFHLSYLGVLMETSPPEPDSIPDPTFHRWQQLNFISHWIVLGTFITNLSLSILGL